MQTRRKRATSNETAEDIVLGSGHASKVQASYICESKGYGVFATDQISKGDCILEYRGELMTTQEWHNKNPSETSRDFYTFHFRHNEKTLCIDAYTGKSMGRLVNDSHMNPNSSMKKMTFQGTPHLCLYASKDIIAGEEITYMYNCTGDNLPWRQKEWGHCTRCTKGIKVMTKQDKGSATTSTIEKDILVPEPLLTKQDEGSANSSTIEKDIPDPKLLLGQKELRVKWDGWSSKYNSWVPATDIITQQVGNLRGNATATCISSTNSKSAPTQVIDVREDSEILTGASYHRKGVKHSKGLYSKSSTSEQQLNIAASSSSHLHSPRNTKEIDTGTSDHDQTDDEYCPRSVYSDEDDGQAFTPRIARTRVLSSITKGKSSTSEQQLNIDTSSSSHLHSPRNTKEIDTGTSDHDQTDDEYCPSSEYSDEDDAGQVFTPRIARTRVLSSITKGKSTSEQQHNITTSSSSHLHSPRNVEVVDAEMSGHADDEYCPSSEYEVDGQVLSSTVKDSTGVSKEHVNNPVNSPKVSSSTDKHTAKKKSGRVTVMQTNNKGKRKWDKVSYCPFCRKGQAKLPRHLKYSKEHQDEPEVIQLKATTNKELKERRLSKMRNYGNYLHNTKVLQEGKGTLIVVYRPDYRANPDDYTPCPDCYGFYSKKELWKHRCSEAEDRSDAKEGSSKKKRRNWVKESKMLLPTSATSKTTTKVLSGLRDDEDGIARLIKGDKLICKLAEKLTNKLGHDKDIFNHIRGKLREVGRTVMAFRKVTGEENACLADMIDPSQFMKVAEATRLASGYSETTHLYETPSLALKIGHSLRKVAEILKSEALMNGDAVLKQKSGDFISLYEMKWEELVSTHALRTLQEKRRNNPKYLPLTADVSKLTKHLKGKVTDGKDKLEKEPGNQQAWRDLAEVTLASLIVFNRKRAGEVSKIKSADLPKLKKGSNGMNFGLSKLEEQLCKILWRIEIVGKKGKTVPVLMTDDMKDAVDLLNKTKESAGIWVENVYLFALAKSEGHLRGVDVLRKHATLCGADNPEHLTSTRLRKHIATVSQVMNLRENEMDILAKFLGHDIRVHREYYRLPEETLQIAKVSKILLSIENGNLQNLAGRNLDDIELLDDEEIPLDDEDEENGENVKHNVEDTDPTAGKKDKSMVISTKVQLNHQNSLSALEQTKGTKTKTKATTSKRHWTQEEKDVVTKRLRSHFEKRDLPGKQQCMELLSEPCLQGRKWTNIKDYVRNWLGKNS